MTHPAYLREKARALRIARKLTIDELAERLALPRTTIYYWVRDLPIPGSGSGGVWPESARRKGTRAMQRKYRRLREAAYREGWEAFDGLAIDPTFRDFVALYIAEGYKRNRNVATICNSDPQVIQMATRWMRRLTDTRLRFWIQHHADQDPSELRFFWSQALSTQECDISLIRKSNSKRLSGRTWRSRHGVLTVGVHDTLFRAKLEAWMDQLRASWQ
jgi:hypothetical protein